MVDTSTTALADAVLGYVKFLVPETCKLTLYPYHNGREQGYALAAWASPDTEPYPEPRVASFSEFRRSDNIAVYLGDVRDFTINMLPDARTYENALFFSWDEAAAAAQEIVNWLVYADLEDRDDKD